MTMNDRHGSPPAGEPPSLLGEKLSDLLEILARLRSPSGCPWDRRQDKGDVGRYLLEETYEVLDAIERGSVPDQQEELGDALFMLLFLVFLARERGEFGLGEVMDGIARKMVRRHPHVFGDRRVRDVAEVKAAWEDIKREVEHKHRDGGALGDVPLALPALVRAQKIGAKAAAVGFDWPSREALLPKIEEELGELKEALAGTDRETIREEVGDLLFTVVNLCRFLEVNAEEALRLTVAKFAGRFRFIEDRLAQQGRTPREATLAEMDALWNEAKHAR